MSEYQASALCIQGQTIAKRLLTLSFSSLRGLERLSVRNPLLLLRLFECLLCRSPTSLSPFDLPDLVCSLSESVLDLSRCLFRLSLSSLCLLLRFLSSWPASSSLVDCVASGRDFDVLNAGKLSKDGPAGKDEKRGTVILCPSSPLICFNLSVQGVVAEERCLNCSPSCLGVVFPSGVERGRTHGARKLFLFLLYVLVQAAQFTAPYEPFHSNFFLTSPSLESRAFHTPPNTYTQHTPPCTRQSHSYTTVEQAWQMRVARGPPLAAGQRLPGPARAIRRPHGSVGCSALGAHQRRRAAAGRLKRVLFVLLQLVLMRIARRPRQLPATPTLI